MEKSEEKSKSLIPKTQESLELLGAGKPYQPVELYDHIAGLYAKKK